jgi:hypothetical protein
MSSGISTSEVRLKAEATSGAKRESWQPDQSGLQPWQFFVLAALGCATAVTVMTRGQGVIAIVLGTALMAGAALIGMAALRALAPLVSPEDDRTAVVGERTRTALEREKLLTLRTIKELEFDRAMGKLSDADFEEMSGRLRTRAARLIRQLDAGAGYRDQIERDLAKKLGEARPKPRPATDGTGRQDAVSMDRQSTASSIEREASAERLCAACSTVNDQDARFCKSCGAKL